MENKGSSYRTKQAICLAVALIGIAVGILLYGIGTVTIIPAVGIILLIIGLDLAVIATGHSAEPDKFGPSEGVFRAVWGVLIAVIGILCVLTMYNVQWFVYVVVLLVVVAIVGILVAVHNNKHSKF